jgi:hypothetical protein
MCEEIKSDDLMEIIKTLQEKGFEVVAIESVVKPDGYCDRYARLLRIEKIVTE